MTVPSGSTLLPRKKSGRKTQVVRLDAPIVRKAQSIADDRGVPISDYLSDLILPYVNRDWARMMKKLDDELKGIGP